MKKQKLILLILSIFFYSNNNAQDEWHKADEILKNIVPPKFSEKKYNVLDFISIEQAKKDIREAIKNAIEKCSNNGGGTVVVPKGEYYCGGPIHLKSNVNLHLEEGTIIKFSTNPDDYLPVVFTRWEGVECFNYSPLIYAYEQENIAITGKGILDGQASSENWWKWNGNKNYGWVTGMPSQRDSISRPRLMKMNNEGVPVEKRIFGKGYYLRPNFVQFIKCKNILLEDITITNSPMWIIHPVLSENITIKNVKTISDGPNTDGCDPESCKNVLIDNCYFDNGDDCIAIKSGRNLDGRRINVPSENIIVRNSIMKDGHGGVSIGSEISGGCRNVFIENCKMDSPNLDRALRIKSNSYRGGVVENIFMRNVEVGEVSNAVIRLNMRYDPNEGNDGKFPPVFRNIKVEKVTSKKSEYALEFIGLKDSPIRNVQIIDCNFEGVAKENSLQNVEELKLINVIINGKKVE
ncbi:MAG: glycoside hydrolase family 28 protein [Melioribacter sp.]|uniref:glycoside hydrolase family 28 protein n=1 Tax=Rosettibacter primus TaxID=3111523 RepID=UPI00247DA8BE|nr:glycoside hydrolase family 28 protein [Melioribacter sp.]